MRLKEIYTKVVTLYVQEPESKESEFDGKSVPGEETTNFENVRWVNKENQIGINFA